MATTHLVGSLNSNVASQSEFPTPILNTHCARMELPIVLPELVIKETTLFNAAGLGDGSPRPPHRRRGQGDLPRQALLHLPGPSRLPFDALFVHRMKSPRGLCVPCFLLNFSGILWAQFSQPLIAWRPDNQGLGKKGALSPFAGTCGRARRSRVRTHSLREKANSCYAVLGAADADSRQLEPGSRAGVPSPGG